MESSFDAEDRATIWSNSRERVGIVPLRFVSLCMTFPSFPFPFRRLLGLLSMGILFTAGLTAATETKSFDIPAGPAEQALKLFTAQSGLDVLFGPATAAAARTSEVKGYLPPRAALDRLLAGSGLYATTNEKTGAITIARDPNGQGTAPKSSDRPSPRNDNGEGGVINLETFEVMGRKTLNMDIRRSRDDAQPYVTFDRTRIVQSGALDLGDFLKQRLTMNSAGQSSAQGTIAYRGLSVVNLRGLGTNQTLILIDGRRIASPAVQGLPFQSDVSTIPLSAIERVEVLPTTSSGIYGGSATGGVVNVILRRDYTGADVKLTYDNSFESDSAVRRFELGAGYSLEEGKTNLLLMASYSDANPLSQGDRDFYAKGVARVLANNPTAFSAATTPLLGATPNIRSTNGSNLTLKITGVSLNSPTTFVPYGYTGIASDQGAALVANAGKYNFDLADTSNSPSGRRWSILSASETAAFGATLRRQFSPWLNAYLDSMFSNTRQTDIGTFGSSIALPATSVANPFNQAITVRAPVLDGDNPGYYFNQNWRIAGGLILKLPHDWMIAADYTWNKARLSQRQPNAVSLTAAGTAAVQAGTPHILRDPAVSPYLLSNYIELFQIFDPFNSILNDATLRVSGPVHRLPGGPVTVSGSVEYRDEVYPEGHLLNSGRLVTYPKRSQTILSGYLETYLPLVGADNARPFIRELGIQIAVRHDDYAIRGNNIQSDPTVPLISVDTDNRSTNPTIAIKYSPLEGVFARASYGLGFLPPNVSQLAPSRQGFVNNTLIDPRRGNEIFGQYDFIGSGNPNLQPEESESWSAGLVVASPHWPGLRFSVDYTAITKTNNITSIASQLLINNEALFPDRIGRGPVPAGDPYGVGPIISVDASAQNISSAELEAYDFALDYEFKVNSRDRLSFFAAATYTPSFKTRILASLPETENVGKAGTFNSTTSPGVTLKWKANAGVTYNHNAWTVGWNMRYFDSYYAADPDVITNATMLRNQGGDGKVASQHYHDLFVRYQFGKSWLRDTEVLAGVRNIFHKDPPFDASNTSSYYSYFGDVRVSSYYVSLRRSF